MSDRTDVSVFAAACFVCFVVGALVGVVFSPDGECAGKVVYVFEGGNASLEGCGIDPRVLENITIMGSDGILVVENLSMLEAFGGG